MGVFNALFVGASGLSSFGEAVRVIGDNIANVNSLGFKSQNVNFSDVLSQTVGVTRSNIANQVGNGVRIAAITRNQAQGSIENTTSPTDMAINGNGLFALRDPASNQRVYTRAGAFILDKAFNLIDGQGNIVQGNPLDPVTQKPVGSVQDITFSNLAAQAQATTKVTAAITLDSNAVVFPSGTSFNPTDPSTFHFKSQINVFDSLGQTHAVGLYFTKAGLDTNGDIVWNWHAAVDGGELKGGTPGTPTEIGKNIYNVANAALPGTSLLKNSIIDGTTALSNSVTIPAGAINDGVGQSNNNAITWTAGQTLQQAIANTANETLSATASAYHVGTATTITASTNVTAGNINAKPSVVTAGVVSTLGAQSLVFGSKGELVTEDSPQLPIDWLNAAPSDVAINYGNATTTDAQGVTGKGLDATVQVAGSFATRQITRDGFSAGFLNKLETDSAGKIFGVFTNGQRRALFQVALAKFPNDAVLNHVGNNLLQETIASGIPVLGTPGNGGLGSITPFGLEQSNVDLANEFVKLIVIQRAYQANAKTILTTDQMLQSLMQIKR